MESAVENAFKFYELCDWIVDKRDLLGLSGAVALQGASSIQGRRDILEMETHAFVLHHLAEVIAIAAQVSLEAHANDISENRQ